MFPTFTPVLNRVFTQYDLSGANRTVGHNTTTRFVYTYISDGHKNILVCAAIMSSVINTTVKKQDVQMYPQAPAVLTLLCGLLSICTTLVFMNRLRFAFSATPSAARWVRDAAGLRSSATENANVLLLTPYIWSTCTVLFYIIHVATWSRGTQSPADQSLSSLRDMPGRNIEAVVTIFFGVAVVYSASALSTFLRIGRSSV